MMNLVLKAFFLCIGITGLALDASYVGATELTAAQVAELEQDNDYGLTYSPPQDKNNQKSIVLLAGDEEYRSEEGLPMLAKILSQHHGFTCTVLFSMSADGAIIDPNNQTGVGGLAALDDADLLIIATRFRRPSAEQAEPLDRFLRQGKPVIGLRTATHAFTGKGRFGDWLNYDDFGIKILGERWVSHHGGHKVQGARSVVEPTQKAHPVLTTVDSFFAPSDVYGVINLTDADQVLLRGAVTESLDPQSKNVEGEQNNPMQPFAWLHTYEAPNEIKGRSFCTTAGAAVDLVDPNLRRLIVNAAYYLTDLEVPHHANVDYVDAFDPSFYGFTDEEFWPKRNLKITDFELGKSPARLDPPGSPEWPYRN
ncbi:MAG: ThuA domain-containing protein [Planctomycetaceae bacterium]|nr:ThuA domain-containing protein [Planctomycetaceae bacterium]